MALFPIGIQVMGKTRAWAPALSVALPALLLAGIGIAIGMRIFSKKPTGKTYGMAMTGSLTAGFSIVFWLVMVPMMLLIAYPARQLDSADPAIEQSRKQMTILVRHLKTFQHEYGRLPVRLEELIEAGYIPSHLLYDPRQQREDAPSYRLMVQELPPESEWATTPILEGRIPDKDGNRLSAFTNETTGLISPNPPPSHAP
jgi:hypothetical protein